MRCGFRNIRTNVWDATVLDPSMVEQADVVLADLPCSGLGIIGKKPDIKERMTRDEIKNLAKLQREILSVVTQYVKPGGTLVYSTCTILDQENQATINAFLDRRPNYRLISTRLDLPINGRKDYQFVKLYPDDFDSDGFFICTLVRIK